jgi:hypothetical protein
VNSASTRSPSRALRWVLALALLAALGAGAWWVLGAGAPVAGSAAPLKDVAAASPAPAEVLAQPQSEPSTVHATHDPVRIPEEAPQRVEASQLPLDLAPTVDLLLRFTDPRRNEIELASGWVEVQAQGGEPRRLEVRSAASASFDALVPGVYSVRASAPGFTHREQEFDLRSVEGAEDVREGRAVFGERLVLWPEGWVAVVVRTLDGRAFEELARELELEPANLFVGAFEARAIRPIPGPDAWASVEIPPLAIFHKPPTYQAWKMPGSSVGTLQLLEAPPMWVGLAVHGRPVGWEPLQLGATEVAFHIDARAFEQAFACVKLRVVDGAGAPIPRARCTLKPDTSAHRRGDLADLASDAEGRITFARVMPGRAELSVLFEEALHQELLELEPGQVLDLGDVTLTAGAAVPLRVIDAEGRPVTAWIEIAPFREGQRVDQLYPPNLHRLTGGDGEYRLPMPSSVSIVRARCAVPPRMLPTDDQSPNVLLDPAAPPSEPLVLVVREPVKVVFEMPPGDGFELAVVDELGVLVVAAPYRRTEEGLPAEELVPGNYTARLLDEVGAQIGETAFTVVDAPQRVRLP